MRSTIKYVSFDVYDTLINRIIPTYYIYEVMESILKREGVLIEDFAKRRIQAEEDLIAKRIHTFSLYDIYASDVLALLTQQEREKAMALEKQLEMNNSVPSARGWELFQKYAKEYRIVCISDMYFDSKFIRQLLYRNGYTCEAVYVSADTGWSKREGILYQYVLEDLHLHASELLHIGDAIRSDWFRARCSSIHAKWLPRIAGSWYPSEDGLYNIGYCILAPILFEFCRWIHCNAGGSKILFMAREGEFLKRCYDILYPNNRAEILYLSRKAVVQGTAFMLLQKCPEDRFCRIIQVQDRERIEDVFRRLGLNAYQYEEQLMEEHLTPHDLYDTRIVPFFQKNKDILLESMRSAHVMFRAYLDEHLEHDNIFVDIGWKGRMQDLLTHYIQVCGDQKIVRGGLYLGILDSLGKQGFLFENDNKQCHDILCFSGLLEILMMPGHGTVIGYEENKTIIEPRFDQFEFSEASYKKICRVQQGIEGLLKQCGKFIERSCFDTEKSVKQMIRFGCHPSRENMAELGSLELYENGITHRLIECTSPLRFKSFLNGFFYSKWKSGFLKKAFRVDLPYEVIIDLVRRITQGRDREI